jgi:hypothetical protein
LIEHSEGIIAMKTQSIRFGTCAIMVWALSSAVLSGCAFDSSEGFGETDIEQASQPVIGGVTHLVPLDADSSAMYWKATVLTRIGVASQAYEDCLQLAATCTVGTNCPRRDINDVNSQIYWDPDGTEPNTPKGHAALNAGYAKTLLAINRSGNDLLLLNLDSNTTATAYTNETGTPYGHLRPEAFVYQSQSWNEAVTNAKNGVIGTGGNLSNPWGGVASSIAHEAMHSHGFHSDTSLTSGPYIPLSTSHTVSNCLGIVLDSAPRNCHPSGGWDGKAGGLYMPNHYPPVAEQCTWLPDPIDDWSIASLQSTSKTGALYLSRFVKSSTWTNENVTSSSKAGALQLSTFAMDRVGTDYQIAGVQ